MDKKQKVSKLEWISFWGWLLIVISGYSTFIKLINPFLRWRHIGILTTTGVVLIIISWIAKNAK